MNYAPDSQWALDPRKPYTEFWDKSVFPMSTGNQVSIEFNLIYRWHPTVSVRDERWTQDSFQKIFPGQDVSQLSLKDFVTGLSKWRDQLTAQKPEDRTFGGLKRDSSGAFKTEDLAKLIAEGTQDVSGKCSAAVLAQPLIAVLTLNPYSRFWGASDTQGAQARHSAWHDSSSPLECRHTK
jgi:linoleate 8R-lipoxygenase / 9,12-octadecadienoate 8-hydroperoxide 8R-isomerase